MEETSVSLLERLRRAPDEASWSRLDRLYRPLVVGWLRRHVQHEDAEDLAQEVMTAVAQELPRFAYDPGKGQFRGWLRAIMRNRLLMYWRSRKSRPSTGDDAFESMLEQLADPHSSLSSQWDREHDRHVLQHLLNTIEAETEPATWQAFRRVAIEGEAPAQVAADLGITINAVYLAKYRLTQRLKREMQGLVE